jgi:hypothetical protein
MIALSLLIGRPKVLHLIRLILRLSDTIILVRRPIKAIHLITHVLASLDTNVPHANGDQNGNEVPKDSRRPEHVIPAIDTKVPA